MLNITITAYFVGPEESGNVFGGVTPNSPRHISGSPFNNYAKGVIKYFDTQTSESYFVQFAGTSPSASWNYISEAQYSASFAENDPLVGTTTGSFVWEKEEYVQ